MKKSIRKIIGKTGFSINRINPNQHRLAVSLKEIYFKYADYTMISPETYIGNLALCSKFLKLEGDIVECGVWRGGMIAGIAEMAGKTKKSFLFDSFEGLPKVKEIDGSAAAKWQQNVSGANYHDNCRAEISYATEAMDLSKTNYQLVKGWFDETTPKIVFPNRICILRLDGDWYDSTLTCLKHLYPKVNKNGLIILDDYFAWDGCSRAVHDYLSSISSISKIYTTQEGIGYIIKKDDDATT